MRLSFMTLAILAARPLALQSQLAICKHRIDARKAPQPRFNQAFRILWVILSKRLESCSIEEVRTAFRSPWQSSFIERYVGTLRKELLDHVVVLNKRHLKRLITEFVENYCHAERPHQGLDGATPVPHAVPPEFVGPTKLNALKEPVDLQVRVTGDYPVPESASLVGAAMRGSRLRAIENQKLRLTCCLL